MSVERNKNVLNGGNMVGKVYKKNKDIKESVERANNIARYICRKYDLEIKTSKNKLVYYYVDCSVDVTEECKVSNYEAKFAKALMVEYTIRKYNILSGEYEDYIWFALYDGNMVITPVYMETGQITDINLEELLYI